MPNDRPETTPSGYSCKRCGADIGPGQPDGGMDERLCQRCGEGGEAARTEQVLQPSEDAHEAGYLAMTSPTTPREARLQAALLTIIEGAPDADPAPDLRSANDYQVQDAGYDRARWEMAEIAREALRPAPLKHLRYWMQEAPINKHAQEVMRDLGITYVHATPQSIGDQWWFWGCKNVPDPLPPFLAILPLDPHEQIGNGLSKEAADKIAAAR